jgi:hypothetical protein
MDHDVVKSNFPCDTDAGRTTAAHTRRRFLPIGVVGIWIGTKCQWYSGRYKHPRISIRLEEFIEAEERNQKFKKRAGWGEGGRKEGRKEGSYCRANVRPDAG